jgi:deoxyribose-phosphate aldolase
LLRPDATHDQIVALCHEAVEYGFASVCVNSCWVALVAAQLAATPVKLCTVVGFPLGASASEVKVAEAEYALRYGAQEIDMVINIGALCGGDIATVGREISSVVDVSHRAGAIVKVIIETALLSDEQKVLACKLAVKAGADFVKTSTGFSSGGATAADVRLMREAVGPSVGVKASGGIRTLEDFESMVAAGATRIGTSAGVRLVAATR